MFQNLIEWLEGHMMPCFYKKFLGVDCPGCGMQRALLALLKGNFWESLQIYPALIPTVVMMIYLVLHLIFHFKNGARNLVILFIFTTTLIVGNYILKLI